MKCRQIFKKPKFSPLFCSQKGSNNILKSSIGSQWRGVHAVPASHGTCGTWARNTEEPSPRRPHGGSQPRGRWGTLLGFQSFHPLGWWRCSVTWMSYIVLHTKKNHRDSGNQKSGTCVFESSQKSRVNENKYVVFRGGAVRIWFFVGRKCSLKLLDPSQTVKTDSKEPWKDVMIKGKDLFPIRLYRYHSLSISITIFKGNAGYSSKTISPFNYSKLV